MAIGKRLGPVRVSLVAALVAAAGTTASTVDAAAAGYTDTVLADHPAAYYRLGEASGATAADASGNGNAGSYVGTVGYGAAGAVAGNTAVTLTDASVAMPASVNPWSGSFTVEAWVMPLATPEWRDAVVINETYQVNGFRLGYDAQLHPVFWTSESGGTTELTASAAMSMNSWHHVAAVRSGTTVTLVVDGAAAGTATNVSYLPPAAGGEWGASSGVPASARFDEVAVFPAALSTTRLQAHYQARAGSACETPATGVNVPAGQSIQAAVDANPAGTTFLLGAGTHRLATVAPKAGDRFYGARSATCARLTTLSGARLLTSFTQSGTRWFATGQTQEGQVHGECEAGWSRCDRPEDLYFDNRPLRHVASLAEVATGTWFFDYTADRVYLGDNPAGHQVEVGTTRVAFSPSATDVVVSGMIVEKYAIPPQMGAIGDQFPAAGWQVLDNEIRLNHGTGVTVNSGSVIRGNHLHDNGQKGAGGTGTGILLEGNEIDHNNYAHVDSGWEAGGTKFALTDGYVARGNCVHDNRGPGLWTDIDNVRTLYENNVVFGNYEEGIFHEISYDVEIRGNRVGHNGVDDPWLYGANILISSSANADVHDNYVEVDPAFGDGITIIWQDRYDEVGNPYRATGSTVHDNEVTYLGASGETGAAADFDPARTEIYQTNSFSGNSYHLPDPAAARFVWNDGSRTFSQFQAAGQDVTGSADGNVSGGTWSCAAT